jgi:sulfite reductase alpha subunit-like flavoprotein
MKDMEKEITALLMQTMQTNKKISRSKAKEILEELVKYLEGDAETWLN